MSPGALLWYFAYGSNLDPRTFLGRRRMRPRDARRTTLADHRLVFDLRIGPGERGVANLLPCPGERVCGVAYQITRAHAARLDRTEGVPQGAYARVDVDLAEEPVEGSRIRAFTYISAHRSEGRKPSERYLNLLLAGARHHRLPDDWIGFLRSLPLAVDERRTQLELDLEADRSR